MAIPNDFYTVGTLFSLTGSATAVLIMTSVIGYVMEEKNSKKLKKWVGLLLSIALALLGATQLEERTSLTWVVAFVNGFLIYLTAVGGNTIVSQANQGGAAEEASVRETAAGGRRPRGSFTQRWW